MVGLRALWRLFRRRVGSRRGNVAMLSALLIQAMTGATGLGVEVSYWGLRQVELQRIADAAAMGATNASYSGVNDQAAANTGADIAELNGISGQASRTWTVATGILTDNKITIKKVSGIKNTANTAFQAIVTEDVNLVVSKLITSLSSVTVSATGYAEAVSGSVNGCLMLTGSGSNALVLDNGATIDEAGCATQVNGSVTVSGGAKITTSGITAGGSITVSNGGSITGTQKANAATFTDVYASDTATQAAITSARSASGSAMTVGNGVTSTQSPGSYSSITINNGANVTLNPGLYLVNGQINITGGAKVTGTGVTIVFTDQMSVSNGTDITLTAPTASAASGVPGMALISASTQDLALNGGSKFVVTGVVYYPNGHIEADNGFGTSASTCSIIIANNIHINGGAKFANNCTSSSGVKNLPVPVGSTVVTLVK